MRENTDQNNSEYGYFSRSEMFDKVLDGCLTRLSYLTLKLSILSPHSCLLDLIALYYSIHRISDRMIYNIKHFQKLYKTTGAFIQFLKNNTFYFSNLGKAEMKTLRQIHANDDNRLGIAREIWIKNELLMALLHRI